MQNIQTQKNLKLILLEDIDSAFRLACLHGQLEVAKELYALKPNIGRINLAYKLAHSRRHTHITTWLIKAMPLINIYKI